MAFRGNDLAASEFQAIPSDQALPSANVLTNHSSQ